MTKILKEKIVVIRKDRKCTGCLCELSKGSKVKYVTGIFDREFFFSYLCDVCDEYLNECGADFDDGYGEGELTNDEYWHTIKARRGAG